MRRVLIISPDPDARRMLELAFELRGFGVTLATDTSSLSKDLKTDVILLDMISDTTDERRDARCILKIGGSKGPKRVILSPRGMNGDKKFKELKEIADVVVRKPYDLMTLVDELVKSNEYTSKQR